jgi:PIN domain nuclease of toxin-antitoxin system
VIVLDTHIWIWWVNGSSDLENRHADAIAESEGSGIGVSAISCWEVAKLVELGRLSLSIDVREWLRLALAYPGVRLLDLSVDIAVGSTRLPAGFHRDPADQMIVATARHFDAMLITADSKILAYPHVKTLDR